MLVTGARTTRGDTLWVFGALGLVYVIWGSNYVVIRISVEHTPPLLSVGPRYALCGLVLGAIVVLRRGWSGLRLTRAQLVACAVLAVLLTVVANGATAVAVSLGVGAGPAALLSALAPISIVVIGRLDGHRTNPVTQVGVVIGFAGLAVLLLGGRSVTGFPFWPSLLVVLSAIVWAYGSYLTQRLDLPSAGALSAYEMLLGGAALTVLAFASGERVSLDWPASTWVALGYLTLGTMVAFTSYTWLLGRTSISLVATHAYVNPVVAVMVAWLMLSEPLSWPVVVGGLTVVTAVVIVISGERPHRRMSPAP